MVKTKHLLYAFKYKEHSLYQYWYETDSKFFKATKPSVSVLRNNPKEITNLEVEKIIENPWLQWNSNDIQKIIASNGVCINYLKSTDSEIIQKQEDLKLLELYSHLVEHFDISKPLDLKRSHLGVRLPKNSTT